MKELKLTKDRVAAPTNSAVAPTNNVVDIKSVSDSNFERKATKEEVLATQLNQAREKIVELQKIINKQQLHIGELEITFAAKLNEEFRKENKLEVGKTLQQKDGEWYWLNNITK